MIATGTMIAIKIGARVYGDDARGYYNHGYYGRDNSRWRDRDDRRNRDRDDWRWRNHNRDWDHDGDRR